MFEYNILETNAPTASKEQLNNFGKEGWELVTIVCYGGKWYYYFKRQTKPN